MSRKQTLSDTSPSPHGSYFPLSFPATLDAANLCLPDIRALQSRIHNSRVILQRLPHSPEYTAERLKIENEVRIMQDELQALEREADAQLHADNMRFLENSGAKVVNGQGSPQALTSPARSQSSRASTPCPDRSRKRDRGSSSSSSNDHITKSMRATPSPAVTGPTTPASPDSLDFEENDELIRLLGGDPKQHMREMREEQRREEEALQAKREQERMDEEMARQMEAENSFLASSPEPSGAGARSSQPPRAHSQTYFSPGGRLQSRQAQIPTTLPSRSSPHSSARHNYASPDRVKFEYPSTKLRPFQPQKVPDFIDLGDDDDFVDLTGNSSSPVENVSNPWSLDRSNVSGGRSLPWVKNEQQIPTINGVNGFSGNASAYALPGSFVSNGIPQQSSSDWGATVGNFLQTGLNAAQSVYNAGSSMLDPRTTYGGTGYGPAGSSDNPIAFSGNYSLADRDNLAYSGLNAHSIDINDPQNQELISRYRDRVDYLTHDPTRTTEEIKSLLENIRPDEDLPKENREGTPDAMTYPLMEHQKLGLAG